MKFEVELISEGCFLMIDEKGNPVVTCDPAAVLIAMLSNEGGTKTKRSYPKGTRRRRAKAAEPAAQEA